MQNLAVPRPIPLIYPPDIPDNCLLYLDMKENGTLTRITDYSGQGNHATNTGVITAYAPNSLCKQWDGAGDMLAIGSNIILGNSVTCEFWLNMTDWVISGTTCRFLATPDFYAYALNNGQVIVTSDIGGHEANSTSLAVALNVWQYLVVTRAVTTGTTAIYVNGVNKTNNAASGTPGATAGSTYIGNRSAADKTYSGYMGLVAVYSGLWTAQQVKTRFNNTAWEYGIKS